VFLKKVGVNKRGVNLKLFSHKQRHNWKKNQPKIFQTTNGRKYIKWCIFAEGMRAKRRKTNGLKAGHFVLCFIK